MLFGKHDFINRNIISFFILVPEIHHSIQFYMFLTKRCFTDVCLH